MPRQHSPKYRRSKDLRRLVRRLTQLARNFHNLDKLAARVAERMRRDQDADPLGLNPITPYTSYAALAQSPTCSKLWLSSRRGRTLMPKMRRLPLHRVHRFAPATRAFSVMF